ncbi:hypothetical protein BCR42DRAFT_399355 [Absidia repens]|uniref:Uncharacterized protein n=1 Tax=Absidia repens TaxID=90262 RepID=A0A1X2IZR8_9FUNG|nr:hypothetical protein BCR42DRAFT_399355 [Absidia repens]
MYNTALITIYLLLLLRRIFFTWSYLAYSFNFIATRVFARITMLMLVELFRQHDSL